MYGLTIAALEYADAVDDDIGAHQKIGQAVFRKRHQVRFLQPQLQNIFLRRRKTPRISPHRETLFQQSRHQGLADKTARAQHRNVRRLGHLEQNRLGDHQYDNRKYRSKPGKAEQKPKPEQTVIQGR